MQHHAHATRAAPTHIRAHHMAAVAPPPHMAPPMVMPAQPQSQPQPQPQQKPPPPQQHAHNNGPVAIIGAAAGNVSNTATAPHMRDHHPRLHQHPQSMHSNSQMHKLRQQHQHMNTSNNNSNNNNNGKNNYQQQQYNHTNIANNNPVNVSAQPKPQPQQQQQTNIIAAAPTTQSQATHQKQQQQHQHQQHPQPQSQPQSQPQPHHQSQPQLQPHHQQHPQPRHAHPSLPHHSQHPHVHPPFPHAHQQQLHHHMRNPHQQHQQVHHQYQHPVQSQKGYAAHSNNFKPKYNNGINNNAPKSILQNPNRVMKGRLQNTAQVNNIEITPTDVISTVKSVDAVPKPTSAGNNIVITTADTTTAVAGVTISEVTPTAVAVAIVTASTNETTESTNEIKQIDAENKINEVPAQTEDAIKAECTVTTEVESTNIKHSKVLSNEDNSVLKNSKEKTPMCLVNELARFNKITHQYRLTNEKGPAHCKRFTVTLKLGDEEYSAEGYKIKKAQHLAAAEAIEKTKYKHPVPKVNRRSEDGGLSRSNITPTVELNALAMKLGQQTYYLFDPRQVGPPDVIGPAPDGLIAPPYNGPPPLQPPHGGHADHLMPPHPAHARMLDPNFMRRNAGGFLPPPMQHPAAHPRFAGSHRGFMPKYPRYPLMPPPPGAHNVLPPPHPHTIPPPFGLPNPPCKVTLIVGKQKFIGNGRTLQQAKHDAAARALQVLKEQATTQLNDMLNTSLDESDSKSPISLVHEIGIKRSMTVHFKVLREEGPAHMKCFITACIVGSIVTEGEGNGKKISKKRAAEKMLEELKKLPPLTPTKSPVRRTKAKAPMKSAVTLASTSGAAATPNARGGERRRRAASTAIKEKLDTENELENPITRLIQLQQNRNEKEPIFELIAKNGNENSRRREFIVEVTAQGMVARGTGNSKKLAKRNAALNLLSAMEANDDVTEKKDPATNTTDKIVPTTLATNDTAAALASIVEPGADVPHVVTPAGQVPGILILRQRKREKSTPTSTAQSETNVVKKDTPTIVKTTTNTNDTERAKVTTDSVEENVVSTTAAPAPATNADKSAVAPTPTPTPAPTAPAKSTSSGGVPITEKLLYLAKLLGFEAEFSDYPKGSHNEFLSIVTLNTEPPQICHGFGKNSEESRKEAAESAMNMLSKLGFPSASK